MDENQKSINEIISELKIEDIKQDDLTLECIEGMLQNQNCPEYDIFSHEDQYIKIYQKSKYYNPFLNENIV